MHIPSIHDCSTRLGVGTIPGAPRIAGIAICDECQYEGIPIVFEFEEEYKKFVRALKREKLRKRKDAAQA